VAVRLQAAAPEVVDLQAADWAPEA